MNGPDTRIPHMFRRLIRQLAVPVTFMLLALATQGCAHKMPLGNTFEPIFPVPPGKAVIYFYLLRERHKETIEFSINDVPVAVLGPDSVCRLVLDPGDLKLGAAPTNFSMFSRYKDVNFPHELKAGEEYFVKFHEFYNRFGIVEVEREIALVELTLTQSVIGKKATPYGKCES